MDNITIFGHVDRDVEKAVQILRDKNIGVVIRNEQDLNLIRLCEDKTLRASKGKENANSSTKGKGKANEDALCQAAPNLNFKSNFTLAQLARRQRERNEEGTVRQLAQRKRRDRERLGECIQPRQVRRRHMDKEPNDAEVIAPNQAMVAPILASSCAIIIPVDNSIGETRRDPKGPEVCSILRLGRRKRQREVSSTQCVEPNHFRTRRLQLMDQETDEVDFNQIIEVSPMLANSLVSSPLMIEDHMSTDPALPNQVVLPSTSLAPDNIRIGMNHIQSLHS